MRNYLVLLVFTIALSACEATEIPQDNRYMAMSEPTAAAVALRGGGFAPSTLAKTAAPPKQEADAPRADRSIIYNATLFLTVPDIRATQSTIQQFAASHNGYLQEISGPSITIRIPAAQFQSAIDTIEHLGELTDRRIEANDVTEEMHDLHIRLDNAMRVRDRLTALLDKATKMEDMIAIEKQLQEVTETIELLKGKLQFTENRVAFSTITVNLNSPRPQNEATSALPFQWVRELANGVVAGDTQQQPDTNRLWKRNERFELPAGFVRYYERDGITEAMSADNVIIRLRREDNYDGGDLGFWSKLVRRAIVEDRAIAISAEQDLTVKDGTAAHMIVGTKDLGSQKTTYLVGVVATKRYVYTFESWGNEETMKPQVETLEKAFSTLDVKHW